MVSIYTKYIETVPSGTSPGERAKEPERARVNREGNQRRRGQT